MKKIEVKHVKALKNSGQEVALINVLPKDVFQKEHIPGSINIPLTESPDEFVQQVESVVPSKNHQIIVYCASTMCSASTTAAEALDNAGFTQVMDFKGGMDDWKKAGENIETRKARLR